MKVKVDEYMDIERRETVKAEARKLRKQFLRYKEAEIVYSIQHKKLLELADNVDLIPSNIGLSSVETVVNQSDTFVIASNKYPMNLVRSKFMKLNSSHIEYVMDCLLSNTTKVCNIKKYILAALFNAPTTMGGYFRVEVNHDMPQLARAR